MIRSEIDAQLEREWLADGFTPDGVVYHEHRYRGGLPPMRLRRMQIHHEGRARRLGLPWDMVDLRLVFKKSDGRCGICGEPVDLDTFTIDHIVPLSKGGGHVFDNLQPAHKACNSRKGSKL
jgi:5-methylcytosine-specific restriction endonuclease McrA